MYIKTYTHWTNRMPYLSWLVRELVTKQPFTSLDIAFLLGSLILSIQLQS